MHNIPMKHNMRHRFNPSTILERIPDLFVKRYQFYIPKVVTDYVNHQMILTECNVDRSNMILLAVKLYHASYPMSLAHDQFINIFVKVQEAFIGIDPEFDDNIPCFYRKHFREEYSADDKTNKEASDYNDSQEEYWGDAILHQRREALSYIYIVRDLALLLLALQNGLKEDVVYARDIIQVSDWMLEEQRNLSILNFLKWVLYSLESMHTLVDDICVTQDWTKPDSISDEVWNGWNILLA